MSELVECAIVGCSSSSAKDKGIMFFRFPYRGNSTYKLWLEICYGSATAIHKQIRPHICAKHFHSKEIGLRRLSYNALPAFNLNNPPLNSFKVKTNLSAAEVEKAHLISLLNDAVLEWAMRGQHHLMTTITKLDLIRIAAEVRQLLGPKIAKLRLDDYWCKKFRTTHLCRVEQYSSDAKQDKTLALDKILEELDPTVLLFRKPHPKVSKEKAKLAESLPHINAHLEKQDPLAVIIPTVSSTNSMSICSKSEKHLNGRKQVRDNKDPDPLGTAQLNQIANTPSNDVPDSNSHSYMNNFIDYVNDYGKPKRKFTETGHRNTTTSESRQDKLPPETVDKDDHNINSICKSSKLESNEEAYSKKIKVTSDSDSLLEIKTEVDYSSYVNDENNYNKSLSAEECTTDIDISKSKPQVIYEVPQLYSYDQALAYLKPLEDFVLRKEDYRAIGLLSNIEIYLKKRVKGTVNDE